MLASPVRDWTFRTMPSSVIPPLGYHAGTQALPPLFALAYHQCRWNYRDEQDVYGVDAKFEEFDFPYDVLVCHTPSAPHPRNSLTHVVSGLISSILMESATLHGTKYFSPVSCFFIGHGLYFYLPGASDPTDMQNRLAERGRKMVTIIDPHIKRDNNYPVHK